MHSATRYWAVIPAAGTGSRLGADIPKQYLQLGDRTVLEHSLEALLACAQLAGVVVAVAADDPYWHAVEVRYRDRSVWSVTGGAERCHSVLRALDWLAGRAGPRDQVLVHDAARPCVRPADIDRLLEQVGDDENGGLLAYPVTDTVKHADARQRADSTLDRSYLWRALTPQLFRIDLLRAALKQSLCDGTVPTDDAAAMECAGYQPLLVQGAADNIKITVPADLPLAEYFIKQRRGA